MEHDEAELLFQVEARPHHARIRTPPRPAKQPALLVSLGGTRHDMFDHADYRRVADIFLAAGHYAASFDLPNHGDLVDAYGEGIIGMAAAMVDGQDVFARIGRIGSACIDTAQRELPCPGGVFLFGISRGGLAALHVMAADSRVAACAIHAPLTYIPAPCELAHLANNPIARRSNAVALVDRLADRPVFMDIGRRDPRVGAEHCLEFYSALCAASRTVMPVFFTAPGQSHGTTYPNDLAQQAAAAFLLEWYAALNKTATGGPADG